MNLPRKAEKMLESPQKVPLAELEASARLARQRALKMIAKAGSGHPGGSLSAMDLIMALYSGEMRFDPNAPNNDDRDRFVLSKGHGVPALYAVMAERGYFDPEGLMTLRELGSPFQGHPANALLPGIEASTGSLGQGLSVAQGIALAGKLKKRSGGYEHRVYCILGDGEVQEGQVWEAALSAPHLKIDNLTAIVDWNKGQIDGLVEDVMPIFPMREKFEAFGWHVLQIDGHDYEAIREALDAARAETQKPTLIIADTVKGKGVSFMEDNTLGWHGKAPSDEELATALAELGAAQ